MILCDPFPIRPSPQLVIAVLGVQLVIIDQMCDEPGQLSLSRFIHKWKDLNGIKLHLCNVIDERLYLILVMDVLYENDRDHGVNQCLACSTRCCRWCCR